MRRALPIVACILLSAAVQTAIFPVAGPLPSIRAQLGWIALVPWFYVLLTAAAWARRPVLRATLWSYLCGVLWYMGHCYWIFQTMHQYGGLSPLMAGVALLLFCLYLGLYHACFGAIAAFVWRLRGRVHPLVLSLLLACVWVAVELARARVTSFPWDLLGYSQVDNAALTMLPPFAGVYAISFLLAFTNVAFTIATLQWRTRADRSEQRRDFRVAGPNHFTPALALGIAVVSALAGALYHAPQPAPHAQAIAIQPNLDPSSQEIGPSPLGEQLAKLSTAAARQAGSPEPKLILWPEAPTPPSYELHQPHFLAVLSSLAAQQQSTILVDANAVDSDRTLPRRYRIYNAAGLVTSNGLQARYNKIHLVPFGEFLPYASLFAFAGGLTEQVGNFDRGTQRAPLTDGQHRYGIFICYESIFPEEVRQLALKGADVLVNLSDDGWYGDTSAPFQHSNMARMRAMENRRWLLRDTNTGITESIDPFGNIRSVAPRHQRLAALLPFAYSSDLTFYTKHGDIFAWMCAGLTTAALLFSLASVPKRNR